MKNNQFISGLVAIVLSVSPVYAQNVSIPTESPRYPSYLNYPDTRTLEVLKQLQKTDVPYKGRWLEKYLKCDGKGNNSEMNEHSNPDYFVIDEKGVCRYFSQGVQ